jgi:prepilin-type N-terminal cleavage/methylation domain-containing protein/prepilin-type processing-associated H-X9-DG protein
MQAGQMKRFSARCAPNRRHGYRGFTLVELLVVIGIIALLISVLLPALTKARRAANTIKCAANVRSILQAMNLYASQYNGYLPGSPNTSGQFIYTDPNYGAGNCPEIISGFDWMSPLCKVMGIKIPNLQDGTPAGRGGRLTFILQLPQFTCPENQFLMTPFGAVDPNFKTQPYTSYSTSLIFMLKNHTAPNPPGWQAAAPAVGLIHPQTPSPFYDPPPDYVPKLSRIGGASEKIFVADGARFSTFGTPPDYDWNYAGTFGSMFSDVGAYDKFSRAWDRSLCPGSGGTGFTAASVDARVYGFRHGSLKRSGIADSYKMNCGFFDGHVELMGDLQAGNPKFWAPKNSQLVTSSTEMWDDVRNKYIPAGVPSFLVP